MTTVGVTNMTQACIDGISDTVAGMQTSTDPYASQTESLATSGAGEIQRLRFVIERIFGISNWYRHDQNINFGGVGVTKTNVQGAGFGQHVTAVGLHLWGGSQRFPSLTGRYVHTTGFFWPAAHHVALAVDPANDADKGGVELIRFHAQGMTLHHTAAIRFWHSAGGSTATGHVTAVSISRGLASMAGNEAAGRDTLLFGHATATMQLVGYGRSHVALGAGSYIALSRHLGTLVPATPIANALYADTIPKAWGQTDGGITLSDSFGVASVTQPDTGTYIVTWERGFSNTVYALVVSGLNVTNTSILANVEAQAATHAVVRTWSSIGATRTPFNAGFNFIAVGRQ